MAACGVEGCDKPVAKTGLCSAHYHRKRKGQPLIPVRSRAPSSESRICLFDGCGRPGTKRGMCPGHYQQDPHGLALTPLRTRSVSKTCIGPDCSRPAVCRGVCDAHYQQMRAKKPLSPLQKIYVRCSVSGCDRANARKGLCEHHYLKSIPKKVFVPWSLPKSPVRVVPGESFARVRVFGTCPSSPATDVDEAWVSLSDVPTVSQYRWRWVSGGYVGTRIGRKNVRMHRLLLEAPPHLEVDHIDGVAYNNRRENLRLVDKKLQAENKRVRSDSDTGLRGVHFDKKKGLYRVSSTKNGVRRGHRHKRLEDAVAEAEALRAQYMTHHNEERSRRD